MERDGARDDEEGVGGAEGGEGRIDGSGEIEGFGIGRREREREANRLTRLPVVGPSKGGRSCTAARRGF